MFMGQREFKQKTPLEMYIEKKNRDARNKAQETDVEILRELGFDAEQREGAITLARIKNIGKSGSGSNRVLGGNK